MLILEGPRPMSEYQNSNKPTSTCPRSAVYKLPGGYRIRLAIEGSSIVCEWQPRVPPQDDLARLIAPYLRARDSWLRILVGEGSLDANVLVVTL